MISILIPIYNGIEYINESVTSVLDQSYENWELIIGVNGHEGNSSVYQIAKDYEDLEYFLFEQSVAYNNKDTMDDDGIPF